MLSIEALHISTILAISPQLCLTASPNTFSPAILPAGPIFSSGVPFSQESIWHSSCTSCNCTFFRLMRRRPIAEVIVGVKHRHPFKIFLHRIFPCMHEDALKVRRRVYMCGLLQTTSDLPKSQVRSFTPSKKSISLVLQPRTFV